MAAAGRSILRRARARPSAPYLSKAIASASVLRPPVDSSGLRWSRLERALLTRARKKKGFYKMDGANLGKVLMNTLCFGQLTYTHITKITTNHLQELKALTKPYVLRYPAGRSPQVKRKILSNSPVPTTQQ